MARSDEERGSGRVRNAFAALVALAVVAAGGMAWQTGWAEEMWDRARGTDGPPADPASVAPPAGIDVPDVVL
ncbi:hypothetical protein E7Z54_20645, partial [Nocardioides sp.]